MGQNMAEISEIYRETFGETFDAERFWSTYRAERNGQYDREGMPVKENAAVLLRLAKERNIPCVVASSPSEEVWHALKSTPILSP